MASDKKEKQQGKPAQLWSRIKAWFRGMKSELKKVVWPSRKTTTKNVIVAVTVMVASGIVIPSEERDAGSVLNAAFLTYVGAAVSSIGTLLYYLVRLGLIGGRRRD